MPILPGVKMLARKCIFTTPSICICGQKTAKSRKVLRILQGKILYMLIIQQTKNNFNTA